MNKDEKEIEKAISELGLTLPEEYPSFFNRKLFIQFSVSWHEAVYLVTKKKEAKVKAEKFRKLYEIIYPGYPLEPF